MAEKAAELMTVVMGQPSGGRDQECSTRSRNEGVGPVCGCLAGTQGGGDPAGVVSSVPHPSLRHLHPTSHLKKLQRESPYMGAAMKQ